MHRIKIIVKKVFFICLILFSFLVFDYKSNLTLANNCSLEDKEYFVKKVFDGDTVFVETSHRDVSNTVSQKKIRLLGIDAFEHDQNIYGIKGKDFLSMLVLNKNVCIETDVTKKDVYERTLGYIFANNLFINEEILKRGFAILSDFPPNTKYLSRLKKAQIHARQNMLGIWEKQSFILETPSQWRHGNPYKKK